MNMNEKDQSEIEKINENPMNFQSLGISSDWQFNGANIANSSRGLVPTNGQMSVYREDLVGASSCPSASQIESFGPALWDQSSNPQNLGFCDIRVVQNNVCTPNTMGISGGGPAMFRTPDMGWNSPSAILKCGVFLPNAPGMMLPQSLTPFPADPAFVERAARFSCFSGGNFSDMVSPLGGPESTGLHSRGSGMMQGPVEVFASSGLKSMSIGQAEKNVMYVGGSSKNASSSVDHMTVERKSESLARSRDEAKQGVGGSGNESDEAEFSGGGRQDDQSMLEGNGRESSAKSLDTKKRKRNELNTELDRAKGIPQSAEAAEENPEIKQMEDQNLTSTINKTSGKQGKVGSRASDPPKEEYIHVRARRGQATNSHSLAERVRREKISERMKFLQDLVPGCSKVTGKAVMLDEIINYVQSLQRQVEFLSMKLATVNPRLDFNIELLAKDFLQSRTVPSSSLSFSPEMPMSYPPLHPSPMGGTQTAFPGMESHADVCRRTISSQVIPISGGFKETAQIPNSWDDELHNVVRMSYGTGAPQDSENENAASAATQELNSRLLP